MKKFPDYFKLIKGDITKLHVDAIVNAANSALAGGGVDGAIHRAAGPGLHKECMEIIAGIGSLPAGGAVITKGYNLPAKFVIHTAGPVWHGGSANEDALLASCYRNCINIAAENNMESIAFPNVSTGVYGFPKEMAAGIALNAVCNEIEKLELLLNEVIFICFDEENYRLYEDLLRK